MYIYIAFIYFYLFANILKTSHNLNNDNTLFFIICTFIITASINIELSTCPADKYILKVNNINIKARPLVIVIILYSQSQNDLKTQSSNSPRT